MSKDSWDDQNDATKDQEAADDPWGDDDATSSVVDQADGAAPGAEADPWAEDSSDGSGIAADTDDFDSASRFDSDDEHDASSDDDEPPQPAEEKKKPSKAKTYAILATAGVLVAGVLGGGYALKSSMQAPANPSASGARQSVEPVLEERVVPEEAATPSRPQISAEPAGMDLTNKPVVHERVELQPVPHVPNQSGHGANDLTSVPPLGVPEVDSGMLADLSVKTDMLAEAMSQVDSRSSARLDKVETGSAKNESRINDLEAQLKEMTELVKSLQEKQAAKPEPRKSEPKKAEPKKAEPKKAEPKKAEPKKPEPKKAEPKKEIPKQAASSAEPRGVQGYTVVATYPSTTQPGMQPEKAWITNGEQLVQVVVGSVVNGAKVNKIQGTTVFTSMGQVRSPK